MNKKTVSLAGVAVTLAIAYAVFFIDWHRGSKIQIFQGKSLRAILRHSKDPGVTFHLDKSYPLTSIEVVAAEDARTNKYPHFLWSIVATNKPVPVTSITYGVAIRGMKPAISNARPEPLDPDTKYSLRIEGDNHIKGQFTFKPPS